MDGFEVFNVAVRISDPEVWTVEVSSSLGSIRVRKPSPVLPEDRNLGVVGEALFRWLMADGVEALWRETLASVAADPRGRAPLRVDCKDRQSILLPWEALWDVEREQFLGHSARTPIFRCKGAPTGIDERVEIRSPLTNRRVILLERHIQSWMKESSIVRETKADSVDGVLVLCSSMPAHRRRLFREIVEVELLHGRGLERAVAEARVELFARSPESGDWAKPLCFQGRIKRSMSWNLDVIRQRWSRFSVPGALFITLFFLGSRSRIIPGLRALIGGTVAAVSGSIGGFLFLGVTLHTALKYCRRVDVGLPAEPLSLQRRVAVRLPIAFDLRIQGRRLNETVFQFFNFLLIVFVPCCFLWNMTYTINTSKVWLDHRWPAFIDGYREALTTFVPLNEAFALDFTIGWNTYPGVGLPWDPVSSLPWLPFWGNWFFVLANLLTNLVAALLLWRLVAPVDLRDRRGVYVREVKPDGDGSP